MDIDVHMAAHQQTGDGSGSVANYLICLAEIRTFYPVHSNGGSAQRRLLEGGVYLLITQRDIRARCECVAASPWSWTTSFA